MIRAIVRFSFVASAFSTFAVIPVAEASFIQDLSKRSDDGWVSPLPPGSRSITDDQGRFVCCVPPPSYTADDFQDRCAAFLKAMKKVRVAYPISRRDWITASDYPASAPQSVNARTVIRIQIDAEGAVTGCEVLQGSGYADLDRAACSATFSRARFHPRLNRDGVPEASDYTRPVTWRRP